MTDAAHFAEERLFDPGRPILPSLTDRFVVPPFSILDTRQGYWQERRRRWMSLGIRSELGRDGVDWWGAERQDEFGQKLLAAGNVSIFDPVLSELAYRWWSKPGARILDPFAGGSVRGIVAASLGRWYLGVELRAEQVAANREQADEIIGPEGLLPTWLEGDSREIEELAGADAPFDLLFSCPPYADLEVYSDDPRDLSTLDYGAFIAAYRQIIASSLRLLAPDAFACFVVADVREKNRGGAYRGFVSDTISAFEDAGARLYNSAVLANAVSTAAMRANRQFSASRKLVTVHQNVLVFAKGDPRAAADACGSAEGDLPEELEG